MYGKVEVSVGLKGTKPDIVLSDARLGDAWRALVDAAFREANGRKAKVDVKKLKRDIQKAVNTIDIYQQ